jgi:hypothetical protein
MIFIYFQKVSLIFAKGRELYIISRVCSYCFIIIKKNSKLVPRREGVLETKDSESWCVHFSEGISKLRLEELHSPSPRLMEREALWK